MNLRYLILGIVGLAFLLGPVDSQAQIWSHFQTKMDNTNYIDNPDDRTILEHGKFVDPQTKFTDRSDGYYYNQGQFGVDLGFTFEYEAVPYTRVNINVNGFITFDAVPLRLGANLSENLFRKDAPNTVIAPFWGNHFYRHEFFDPGYVGSEISIHIEGDPGNRVATIEWKSLNINYFFDPNNVNDPLSPNASPQASSVGTFQVKLYESAERGKPKVGKQGDIEFHYSTVADPKVPGIVKTSGASVGLESHQPTGSTGQTSFMNGLYIDDPLFPNRTPMDTPENVRTLQTLTSTWTPSRRNNNVIHYSVIQKPGVDGWGDGDANLSQLPGARHFTLGQNRFVTTFDVIGLMRTVAQNIPYDSLFFRNAYHADVNHNGRYYYSTRNEANTEDVPMYRREIKTKSIDVFDSLPPDNSREGLFFYANEYDAALILNYMAGKVPALPWLLDIVIDFGKVGAGENVATKVDMTQAELIEADLYRVPVYLNGDLDGALGLKFDVNGVIEDIQIPSDQVVKTQFFNGRGVISASGSFNAKEAIAYVHVRTAASIIEITGIRFNDMDQASINVKLENDVETLTQSVMNVSNYPNPFTASTDFSLNLPSAGLYTLEVYDMVGNKVNTLINENLEAGAHTHRWDGIDAQGNVVPAGMYIYHLVGPNVAETQKLTVVR